MHKTQDLSIVITANLSGEDPVMWRCGEDGEQPLTTRSLEISERLELPPHPISRGDRLHPPCSFCLLEAAHHISILLVSPSHMH
jgi:hypothetical protein